MRKSLVLFASLGAFAVAVPSAYAGGHHDGHGHGQGHHKSPVCHKPGTPAQKTLYLPEPAIPGHLGHGDYRGQCKPPSKPPTPPSPPKPPTPPSHPAPPAPAPTSTSTSTSTSTTVVNVTVVTNVTITAAPAAGATTICPCPTKPAVKHRSAKHRKHCRKIKVARYRKVWFSGRDCCGRLVRWYKYKKVYRHKRVCA